MNIQINCKDNIDKNELLYIFYNLPDYIKEYEENKNNFSYQKFINGKRKYYKKLNGNWSMSTDIDLTCTGITMYFKINNKE